MHTGLNEKEIQKNLTDKENILNWMVKNKVNTVNGVGMLIAEYYRDPENVMEVVNKNGKADRLIPKHVLKG